MVTMTTALFTMDIPAGSPVVQVAMDEEAEPFITSSDTLGDPVAVGRARFFPLSYRGRSYLLVRSGIGLANAASAATAAILAVSPEWLSSAGSAGGLRSDVEVGDVLVGTDFRYADADATAFGYSYGQVPGMPERYGSDAGLAGSASGYAGDGRVREGQMLAGGSFVTAANVTEARAQFPDALSVDMETTAIAQVASNLDVPFVAVRCISDLCGPAADQEFHLGIEIAARRSADAVLALIAR